MNTILFVLLCIAVLGMLGIEVLLFCVIKKNNEEVMVELKESLSKGLTYETMPTGVFSNSAHDVYDEMERRELEARAEEIFNGRG